MLLEKNREITPKNIERWSQSENRTHLWMWLGLSYSSDSKESTCTARDLGLIPGSGRSPREGNGNPCQYSCLENPMDRGVSIKNKKRRTTWELWIKFYLGKNEDFSLGDSISDNSERLLQSSNGGKSIYKVLVKGELNTTNYSKGFLLVMRIWCHHEGIATMK